MLAASHTGCCVIKRLSIFLPSSVKTHFPKTETFVTYYFPELSSRDQIHVWPGNGPAQFSNGIAI